MPAPSSYTQEIADSICEKLTQGLSLRTICSSAEYPPIGTVMRWLQANESFREQYARAREAQADVYAQEIIDISDDGRNDTQVDDNGNEIVDHDHIARSRLRVDARKWYASKVAPKKYGDSVKVEGPGAGGAFLLSITQTDTNVL